MNRYLLVAAGVLALTACTADAGPSAGRRSAARSTGAEPAPQPIVVPGDSPDSAGTAAARQVIYVPAYSHIFLQDSRSKIDLAVTLSVRNTDPQYPISIASVRYYDDRGALVRSLAAHPVPLGPLASTSYVVDVRDNTAGVGANFIVEWAADHPVTEPLVESVMISGASALGISFTSRGVPLRRPAE